ncbi:MAG: nucleotidyltransferase domain-containing protein [Candidatus Omnitrophota bacterium]|jgi:predicted nucleotidyltransferase|nr:MAG: nucleotidyltransferase domain-containing protein [Candidatus Omnitrophota bacterium]
MRSTLSTPSAYIPLILERLKQIHPYKIILYGSHAYGNPDASSDIDLLVVIDRDDIPETFREKSDLYLETVRVIRDLQKQISIDLIVHTKAMYRKFIDLGSMFSQEIVQKGIVLYETDHERVVGSGQG